MTKMENKSNILQRLNAESNDNYEKVASRMRLAMKIADAIEASGMTKKEIAARLNFLWPLLFVTIMILSL